MNSLKVVVRSAVMAGLLCAVAACSSSRPSGPKVTAGDMAKAKVDAMRKLADAVARDPRGSEAMAAVDDLNNTPFDAAAYPKEGDEILSIYRQRVQGKLSGTLADDVRGEIARIEAALKRSGR